MRVEDKETEQRILDNQGLVGDAIKRYSPPPGWEHEDWVGQINLIYVRACIIHDPSKGRLSTIMGNMIRHEYSEIRAKRDAWKRNRGIRPLSLGALIEDQGHSVEPEYIDRGQDPVDARDELEHVLPRLRPVERKLFELFAGGMSGPQIAKSMGWSYKSYPNRIMADARKRIKEERDDVCL